jgi:hypothetical protein
MRKMKVIAVIVLVQAMLCGCGSANHSDFDTQQGALRISPASASVQVGASVQFKALMNSDWIRDVRWSLSGNCTGAQCGTVDSNGFYTAPSASPGRVTLSATLSADGSKRANAEINVTSSYGTLEISPSTATVVLGEIQSFEVTNCFTLLDITCSFELSGLGCSGDSCGTLSSTLGTSTVYTAPTEVPDPATVYLRARDLFKSRTAVITIVGNGDAALPGT